VNTYRGAIVGFGRVAAEAHVPALRRSPGFEIAAVVDLAAERRARALEALPGVRVYPELSLMADEGVQRLDFVDVATPPRAHGDAVKRALEQGCHVLCEKPLALDLDEVRELSLAARRSGRVLFTVHNWKYAPLLRRLHGILRTGAVGEPREIDWEVLRPGPPRGAAAAGWRVDRKQAGGGILMDHGWHAFYLMLFLTERDPKAIAARLTYDRGFEVESAVDCEIDFQDLRARIRLRWGASGRRTTGVVRGTLGRVSIEDDRLVVAPSRGVGENIPFPPGLSASSYHPEWFPDLLDGFRSEIELPDHRGRNLAEAVRVAEMIEAAYRSEGRRLPLSPPQVEAG
jgi:predicted dehydrogenase